MSQRKLVYTGRFRKDLKRAMKRGWDLDKAQAIVDALMLDHPLPANARPHKLSGKHENAWDAHIAPDWILVYEIDDNTLILRRTGSHADLF